MSYDIQHKARIKDLKSLGQKVTSKVNRLSSENWTFVLDDDTELTKAVTVWTSGT